MDVRKYIINWWKFIEIWNKFIWFMNFNMGYVIMYKKFSYKFIEYWWDYFVEF